MRHNSRRGLGDVESAGSSLLTTGGSPAGFLSPSVTSAQLQTIPNGDAGVAATLRIMKNMARASLKTHHQTVRNFALLIVQDVTPRDWAGEVEAMQQWVRDQIKYRQDPDDIELVQTPEKTLEFAAGDCDDKSTLLASLLLAIGHPARFRAMALEGGYEFTHVMTQSKIADRWVNLETIIAGAPIGWAPPGCTRDYLLNV